MWVRRVIFPLAFALGASEPSCAVEDASRLASALSLMKTLNEAGMMSMPLTVKATKYGGLGVFTKEAVSAGTTLIQLPNTLMLESGGSQASLPLALAKQRRNATNAVMQAFIKSLPATCPDNLALAPPADHALVAASLHAWKVDLLAKERAVLLRHAFEPVWSEDELQWALCIKLSRAFAGVGSGPVMMPFIDMVNHAAAGPPTCSEGGRWVDEAAGKWVAEVTALRDLEAGEELTYTYSESPSKARMLTSFGFSEGAPHASLAASELPARDAAFLAAHGCVGAPRTDLYLSSPPPPAPALLVLTPTATREAIRCIRLRLYEPEEAAWAVTSGHLSGPWGGLFDAKALRADPTAAEMLPGILMREMRIAERTGALCHSALSDEKRAGQRALAEAASPALREAILQETIALDACAAAYRRVSEQIEARGRALFGGDE